MMTVGEMAYREDCKRQPYYIGAYIKRRTWDDLADYERATWERNPTARDWDTEAIMLAALERIVEVEGNGGSAIGMRHIALDAIAKAKGKA